MLSVAFEPRKAVYVWAKPMCSESTRRTKKYLRHNEELIVYMFCFFRLNGSRHDLLKALSPLHFKCRLIYLLPI